MAWAASNEALLLLPRPQLHPIKWAVRIGSGGGGGVGGLSTDRCLGDGGGGEGRGMVRTCIAVYALKGETSSPLGACKINKYIMYLRMKNISKVSAIHTAHPSPGTVGLRAPSSSSSSSPTDLLTLRFKNHRIQRLDRGACGAVFYWGGGARGGPLAGRIRKEKRAEH